MSEPSPHLLSRRLALSLAAGTLAAPVLGAGGGAAAVDGAAALVSAYRRIRYSAGAGLSFWWMRATKYGLVDQRLTPLFGMEIGNIARTRGLDSGGFAATSLEIVFFTDPATGERLEALTNPYTGERLARPDSLVGPVTVEYRPEGPKYPAALPGVRFEMQPAIGVFAVEGDDVWLRDDNATTVRAAADGSLRFQLTDQATYLTSRAALADATLESVPATVSFGSVSGWMDWLKMAGRPGSLLSRASGRKYARLEDLPPAFLGLLRARYPELARDPAAALERPPYGFTP